MRVVKLRENQESIQAVVCEAARTVRQGGIAVCPTDTCYILVADGLNDDAIRRVCAIKARPPGKPISVIVDSIEMAKNLVFLTEPVRAVASAFLPGPLTLILRKKPIVPDSLTANNVTLGLRVPNHDFSRFLARAARTPITATSANVSGGTTPRNVTDALWQLNEMLARIDLVVDGGGVSEPKPSTIVDLSGAPPRILREGPIPAAALLAVIAAAESG